MTRSAQPASSQAHSQGHAGANGQVALDPSTRDFYCAAMKVLRQAGLDFLVGGAYAFARYTGIERHTKDFDIFVRHRDAQRALDAFAQAGYHTEMTFPHWLGKAFRGEEFVDVIFGAGNGIALVDDEWFEHASEGVVLGVPAKLCPPEEMLWSKAFVQERERFDGADVAHLLRASAESLNWQRLLERFGANWRVLYAHLILFGFTYPSERGKVPADVLAELGRRLDAETAAPPPRDPACRGTLLSRAQYLIDIDDWGYQDARLQPRGSMTPEDTAHWTAAIHTQP